MPFICGRIYGANHMYSVNLETTVELENGRLRFVYVKVTQTYESQRSIFLFFSSFPICIIYVIYLQQYYIFYLYLARTNTEERIRSSSRLKEQTYAQERVERVLKRQHTFRIGAFAKDNADNLSLINTTSYFFCRISPPSHAFLQRHLVLFSFTYVLHRVGPTRLSCHYASLCYNLLSPNLRLTVTRCYYMHRGN